ncbi:hypothetical protein FDP41_004466 [Naegleria fowleri]|uniref:Pseudouridine synthase RsuA/RluA-like domain-containing protein n=1 Tax=Naegleria fowleri TaxID=5763 RepID=A0A6A5BI07_NAEFO|nr:uncharacterized protein FDP41_004466 [Naegleria fowleri]KAF0976567.1 hypothetical protein FDP41_004466 [Naegleria fowleri]
MRLLRCLLSLSNKPLGCRSVVVAYHHHDHQYHPYFTRNNRFASDYFNTGLLKTENNSRNYSSVREKTVDVLSLCRIRYLDKSGEKDVMEGRRKIVKFSVEAYRSEEPSVLNEKIRTDKLLSQLLPISREYAQFLLSNGHVKINSKKSNEDTKFVKFKDLMAEKSLIFEIYLENRPIATPVVQSEEENFPTVPIHVLYEDNDVIVVNKPFGYAVHASKSHPESATMINAIRRYCTEKYQEDQKTKKKPVKPTLPLAVNLAHRLETQMSGVLICGKNSYSNQKLSAQFEQNSDMSKQYLAVCAVSDVKALKKKLNPYLDMMEEFNDDNDEEDEAYLASLSEEELLQRYGVKKVSFADLKKERMEELFNLEDVVEYEEDEDIDLVGENVEENEHLERSGWIDLSKDHDDFLEKMEKAAKNKTITMQGDVKLVKHPTLNKVVAEKASRHDELMKNVKILKDVTTVCKVLELNEENSVALVSITIPSGSVQQVRSHLATHGIPMLGDLLYFDQVDNRVPYAISRAHNANHILFHLHKITFQHPITGKKIVVRAPLLSSMKEFISKNFSEAMVRKYVNLETKEQEE